MLCVTMQPLCLGLNVIGPRFDVTYVSQITGRNVLKSIHKGSLRSSFTKVLIWCKFLFILIKILISDLNKTLHRTSQSRHEPKWVQDCQTSFLFDTLRPRQNGRHFADDTFKPIFLNENIWISIKISLKFLPKVLISNNPSLVQVMAWCRPGDKPLSEPMMDCLLTHGLLCMWAYIPV